MIFSKADLNDDIQPNSKLAYLFGIPAERDRLLLGGMGEEIGIEFGF